MSEYLADAFDPTRLSPTVVPPSPGDGSALAPADWALLHGAAAQPVSPHPPGGFLDPSDTHAKFFDSYYAPVAAVATQLGVDPALLLGLSAQESGWGTSRQALQLGNPFGFMIQGKPQRFASPGAAWQAWARSFGPRVRGVGSDVDKFVGNLAVDQRTLYGPPIGGRYTGAYNANEGNWASDVTDRIHDMRYYLPRWLGNLDALP
jgi:hypothetical protein